MHFIYAKCHFSLEVFLFSSGIGLLPKIIIIIIIKWIEQEKSLGEKDIGNTDIGQNDFFVHFSRTS